MPCCVAGEITFQSIFAEKALRWFMMCLENMKINWKYKNMDYFPNTWYGGGAEIFYQSIKKIVRLRNPASHH
jgi:hypothetical protein